MFSATWPIEVHKLAQEYMDPNPVKVRIFIHKDILVIYLFIYLFQILLNPCLS